MEIKGHEDGSVQPLMRTPWKLRVFLLENCLKSKQQCSIEKAVSSIQLSSENIENVKAINFQVV